MLTIDLAPQTEARVNRFLSAMDPDVAAPASAYAVMLLADLLQFDWSQTRQALERIRPREVRSQPPRSAERGGTVDKAPMTTDHLSALVASNLAHITYRFYMSTLWERAKAGSRVPTRPQEEAMRIDLDLPEEMNAAIRVEAAQRGIAPHEYVARILDGIATLADLITPSEPMEMFAETFTATSMEPHQQIAEEIIVEAIREFKESQIHLRERAVKVITQKNNLAAEIERNRRIIAELELKSHKARSDGNRNLALAYYRQKPVHERALDALLPLLAEATELAEQVKNEIRREEERIRERVAEAMLLTIGMKAQAIQFQYGHAVTASDATSSSDIEADFERWSEQYDREQHLASAALSAQPEDVEATLKRLKDIRKESGSENGQ